MSTINTILGSGNPAADRTDINDNFSNLNADKVEETGTSPVSITIADAANAVGLTINQNDATNDPLALLVNGPSAGSAAKVTTATLVQVNDESGSNSDWSFNVAAGGYPTINLQATGGTLASPTASGDGTVLYSILGFGYNSANTQKRVTEIKSTFENDNSGAEYGSFKIGLLAAGTLRDTFYLSNGYSATARLTTYDAGATGVLFELYHDSASPAANDIVGDIDFYGKDSAGIKQQYAQIQGVISDTTSTSEDGILKFGVVTAGTVANELELIGSALYPTTNDGLALGTTTAQFSDLFLASGGVINFASGDVTITHGTNDLQFAGSSEYGFTGGNLIVYGAGIVGGTFIGTYDTNGSHQLRFAAGSDLTANRTLTFTTGDSDRTIVVENLISTTTTATRSMVLTASGGVPTTTAGCAAATKVEAGTNDVDYYVLDFDTTTEERAFWNVVMPDNWNGSTVTAQFYWTNASGASTQTVDWGIKARAFADSDAIDQAYGTEITTTDTWLAQGDVHISGVSTAITVGGSPAGGQYVVFNVGRKVASDNMAGDARLLAVKIEYGINAYSE